jgi:hypothetical protein
MGRWLDKVLNSSHLVTNLKKEAHVNTRKIKINQRKGNKNNVVIKAKERVDINPDKSYIVGMKEKTITITVNGTNPGQWSNLLLELNIMKKAWRPFGVNMNLKAPGIKNIIEWGTRNNEYVRPRQNSKRVQPKQR